MITVPKISDLHSKKARNLLRGIIGKSDRKEVVEALENIRRTCSELEFHRALRVVRANPMFKRNPIGSYFNKFLPQPIDSVVAYSALEVLEQLRDNSSKLALLGRGVYRIYANLANFEIFPAIDELVKLVEQDGASIFVLRILHFIRNHSIDNPIVLARTDQLILQLRAENLKHLSLVIRELSSPITDYFNIRDKIHNSEHEFITCIAKYFLDHIPRTEEVYLETLNSFNRVSLLDAYLFQYHVQRLNLPFIPRSANTELDNCFSMIESTSLDIGSYYLNQHDVLAHDYFRENFLLIEMGSIFDFRTIHGAIFNSVENKQAFRVPLEKRRLSEYYARISSMSLIGKTGGEYRILANAYDGQYACNFSNSCALVYYLERTDGDLHEEEREFVRLMSVTRDIGIICPLQHIESIKSQATTDELKVVAICLAYIRQKSQIREHELRSIIQSVIKRGYASRIVDLLAHIFETSPAVTEHLIHTCDETFLSKLFLTIPTPNKAIEERASILEWYGVKIGDASFLERAKNLRIDVQISKEKGTIDDSRIYVDPVKFTQWINDHVLNKLTLLLEMIPVIENGAVQTLNWEKVKTGLTAYDQLGAVILKCYDEFCTNTIYGIASYLGRRIRHGTLKGTGLTDVKNFAQDSSCSDLFQNRDFAESFAAWMHDYETMLDSLRDRYLHINSRSKSAGMIGKDFNSVMKKNIGNYLAHDIIRSFDANKSGLELPYIITEYCWRLIEEDLAGIRKFLMEIKAKYAVFRPEISLESRSSQRYMQEFCRELNSITAEKFRAISSWFNKPSIASPSADIALLFKAVVSEIKGFFPIYSPMVHIDEGEFIISGGLYFVIYDALFILIYNAARYGREDGMLEIHIKRNQMDDVSSINIVITSEISPFQSIDEVQNSIAAALDGDCEDALVVEGRSGIKKLRRMEQGNYIDNVQYAFSAPCVHASFDFKVNY